MLEKFLLVMEIISVILSAVFLILWFAGVSF